jgi:hypothetical protein
MLLKSHFDTFLSNIEPTQNQKSEASKGHNTLRDRLAKDDDFREYFADSFLSGSYARNTAVRPIKDVDIIIIMNIAKSNEPSKVINYVEKRLKKYYSNTKRQTRSVNVSLSYVNMDIVPTIAKKDNYGMLLIPDRIEKEWTDTHPRKHIELSTKKNDENSGLYKPLVKSLKRWRDVRMKDSWKPKSFLLETMVYYYAEKYQIKSIPESIRQFFFFVYSEYSKEKKKKKYSPIIKDPSGTNKDVAQRWSLNDFNLFYEECIRSWNLADQAIKSDDYNESVSKWCELLGDSFPK